MKSISREEYERVDPISKSKHPDQILTQLVLVIEKIGSEKFLSGAGYNKERDSLVSVLFAYGLRKWSQREWFLQQISDPPDFHMISPTDRPKKPIDRFGVEIVEIREGNSVDAIEILERAKLTHYFPGRGTRLLIFLNNTNTTNAVKVGSRILEWALKNKDKFSEFSEVYLLFIISFSKDKILTYRVINLFNPWSETCYLSDEFNKGIVFPHPLIDKHAVKIVENKD